MPLFVDHVGLNSLINDNLDLDNNTRNPNFRVSEKEVYTFADGAIKSDNSAIQNTKFLYGQLGSSYSSVGSIEFSFWTKLDTTATDQRQIFITTDRLQTPSTEAYFLNDRIYFVVYDNAEQVYKSWHWSITMFGFTIGNGRHVFIYYSGNINSDPRLFIDNVEQSSPTSSVSAKSPTDENRTIADEIYLLDRFDDDNSYELDGYLQTFYVAQFGDEEGLENRVSFFYNSDVIKTSLSGLDDLDILDFWLLGNEIGYLAENQPLGSRLVGLPSDTVLKSKGTRKTQLSPSGSLILVSGGTSDNPSIITGVNINFVNTGNHIAFLSDVDEFAALNTHRNGPYGFSTWRQLRASENPITRRHKENSTMTFVVQPGPVRNVLSEGELRVRDRYSALYTFTEPAIAQKAYPLVWNVGRHFKDENGNVDLENPERFSIISSYANQGIGFANNQVDKLHKFDPDEEKTEYREIYKLYAEGGLNNQASPLTHWEFLQYRETVFPHMKNQFQNENLERPNFISFYRHNREDRSRVISRDLAPLSFGFPVPFGPIKKDSVWTLDASQDFLTEEKSASSNISFSKRSSHSHGIFQSFHTTFIENLQTYNLGINSISLTTVESTAVSLDSQLAPYPVYNRRTSLQNTASVSSPSGMLIPQTGGLANNILFEGSALWEAGATRQIKDADGNYVSAPKTPFYDTYEDYIEEARRRYKNYSVVPEFRMSTQVEDYLTNNNAIELDMFDVTGGVENAQNSSQAQFYEVYSNSDFMRQFELINEDHKEFTNGKVLSLRCKAVKKFLPYEGFYPAQRTVDLAKRFYDSFKNNISLYNANGVQLNDFNFGRQMVMTPLFAPGVLFNTIKSGIAVDYPIITGSLDVDPVNTGVWGEYSGEYFIYNRNCDKRIPFEALIEPHDHLAGFSMVSNEPHPSGNLSASAQWDGQGDELYSKMANNFLAAVPEFFLPNGQLTSVVSKKQKDITLVSGSVYGMRVKMRRSMDGGRGSVYHSGSKEQPYYPPQDVNSGSLNVRESFTMYSRPSAFGPPSLGNTLFNNIAFADTSVFSFDSDSEALKESPVSTDYSDFLKDSLQGFNFPFTPPYYHGEAWCEIVLTASSDKMSIAEIQSTASYTFKRFDSSFYRFQSGSTDLGTEDAAGGYGLQSLFQDSINKNAVQLSASLNLQGIGKVGKAGGGLGGASGNLVVDSAVDEDSRWIIQTKFETPMFNFNHISEDNGTLSVPVYGSESVPRGMWHQYGRIPEENEGVFLEVGPIEENWWRKARGESGELKDLSAALGFSGQSTKIGRLRSSKTIYEAVVAVPFIEQEGRKKFFSLDPNMVEAYKQGGEARASLTTGDPQTQIGRSVLKQMQKMEKYIFPPSFDFLNNNIDEVKPIAMYIFEFSHTLNQQDLADIWQNLPPDIGTEMEESEVAITHPLLKKELLGEGGESGNTLIDMPNKLKWMVFKVKQRAASNYFKKTVLRNPDVNTDVESGNVTVDEFGATSHIQYNWPYDFFSLVELVKIDSEVEFGNFRDEDIANYTDSIPPYEAQTADMDKIEFIVGGMGDDIVADTEAVEEYDEQMPSTGVQISTRDRLANRGVRDSLSQEGIFDVPNDIPSVDRQYYTLFKGRFTVEANKDPLGRDFLPNGNVVLKSNEGWGTLFNRTGNALKETGQIFDDRNAITARSLVRWTQEWYSTDPGLQQKKFAAQQNAFGIQDAINASQQKSSQLASVIDDMRTNFIAGYNEPVLASQLGEEWLINAALQTVLNQKEVRKGNAKDAAQERGQALYESQPELFLGETPQTILNTYFDQWLREVGYYD